ncbi:hypothetical protein DUI87_34768 [Hirundo rustica rustica]|uniref:ribonuclease H n=1 Tax=Hirundo rustica rustica TaxID=333673 RepID=A0A3M0IJ90_HIRRU|nr:hypothetical protein DUI87_34768 [Hirundo rustica rustica]
MEQQDEPLVNFDVGPQSEEYEFLVDTGADRSSLRKLPTGVTIGTKTCEVLGAEGRPFRALIIEGVEIKGNSKYCVADFLYLPHTETNLLGRDLQVQLGVGVIPKDGKMVVHIMKLTQGDIQEINPEVWATEGKYGCLDIPPIKIEMQKDTPAIRVKQYPMSPEGKKGLASVIEHLLKENILEPCMSPHNTPILAIKKDEGKFRLVQDLREINKRTIARHPVVPNPYTLLSKIPREHTWFTVIDLKDAFWACPLAEECRDWFAFEWEHPDRGRKQQLRWTRLPQGYTESRNIFGQALETLLEQFSPTEGVQILQYVDDLLISGETEKEVKNVSIQLLNFFGEKGLKVSQSKLQFVETEVTYLGHIIGKGSKRLSPARISGIVSISPPKTKRDVRKLLGLFGYCKHWIDKYTQGIKFLYDKLIDQEPMNWTESDEKQLQDLKEKLSSAPVLSLPDLKKEFDLFVNTEKGIAYGVLTQEWGGYRKSVAFLSKLLDPVARGWPACLQAVAAAAILIEEAQKLTLQGKIKIHTSHDLKTILSQRAQKWLTDSRILKYEIILINTDNLELTTSKSLNPAQFLSGEPTEEIEHHCLELIDMQTKVREDLEDTPLPYGRVLFTDGSSRVVEGKRTSGYSVIEGEKMEVLEKGKLPRLHGQSEEMSNSSSISHFLLLALADTRQLQLLHFCLFLGISLAALLANGLIISAVACGHHLHTPMFFFLLNLALTDLGSICTTVPKAMHNSLWDTRTISYTGCAAQLFFFLFFIGSEYFLLTIICYDRYVSICKPLHYGTLLGSRACAHMAAAAWASAFLYSLLHTANTFSLPLCHGNVLGQFFCEIPQILKLSCSKSYLRELGLITVSACLLFACFVFIVFSYVQIFRVVLRIPTEQGRHKAFSTCLPHLAVVSLFLSTVMFAHLKPPSVSSPSLDLALSVLYSVVPPTLNPLIYSLRNQELKAAVWRLMTGCCQEH